MDGLLKFNFNIKGAHAIILTFSLVDSETLANTKKWLNDVLEVFKSDDQLPLIFLVGTKKDLLDSTSKATIIEAERNAFNIARELNAEYWPVSSLNGNVINQNLDKYLLIKKI